MQRFRKTLGLSVTLLVCGIAVPAQVIAQTCLAPPTWDVLLFLDNSGSIDDNEFSAAQQAVAGVAQTVLGTPGNRLAVVNWGCTGGDYTVPGCRTDLATGSAIPGGWSTNANDFAYAGVNSASNKVCRSFGNNSAYGDRCGGGVFNNGTADIYQDHAQDALRILDGMLYSGGGTGGTDSYGAATLAPASISASPRRLMIIHMTDAAGAGPSTIMESLQGNYYYSNRFKNSVASGGRNAVIVGVGIGPTTAFSPMSQLGAFASKGGSGFYYDAAGHAASPNVQAFDLGTPRLTASSSTYNSAQIVSATNSVFTATVPACVILRKESTGGTGSFSFGNGTNGLPSSLTITTTAIANPQSAPGVNLTQFNTDSSITETVPSGWKLNSVACTDVSGASVTTTSNLTTGLLTIPGSAVVSGAKLTCTFSNGVAADLSIAKTNTPGSGVLDQTTDAVVAGATTTYSIVVTNNGATPVTGAVLRDPAANRTGLTCSVPPTCTGTACPAGPLTVAGLDSPGFTLGTLAAGQTVTVTLTCTVL